MFDSLLNLLTIPALWTLGDDCVTGCLLLGGKPGLGTSGCCGGGVGSGLTGDTNCFGGRDGGGGDGCRGFYK